MAEKSVNNTVNVKMVGRLHQLLRNQGESPDDEILWREVSGEHLRRLFPNSKYEIGTGKTYDGRPAWTIRLRLGALQWLTFIVPAKWPVYADGNVTNPLDEMAKLSLDMTIRLKALLDGIELYEGTVEVLFGAYWYDIVSGKHFFEVEIMPDAAPVHMLLVNNWDRSLDWQSTGQPQNPREAYRRGVIYARASISKSAVNVDKTPLAGCNQLIFKIDQWSEMQQFCADLVQQKKAVYQGARQILQEAGMVPVVGTTPAPESDENPEDGTGGSEPVAADDADSNGTIAAVDGAATGLTDGTDFTNDFVDGADLP